MILAAEQRSELDWLQLPVVVAAVIVITAGRFPADGLVLLGQDVDLLPALGVRRRHEVAAVVDQV